VSDSYNNLKMLRLEKSLNFLKLIKLKLENINKSNLTHSAITKNRDTTLIEQIFGGKKSRKTNNFFKKNDEKLKKIDDGVKSYDFFFFYKNYLKTIMLKKNMIGFNC